MKSVFTVSILLCAALIFSFADTITMCDDKEFIVKNRFHGPKARYPWNISTSRRN